MMAPGETVVGPIFGHEEVVRRVRGDELEYQCSLCDLAGQDVQTFDQHSCDGGGL